MFWLTLTLMLGTLFDDGGPVIGISIGALFGLILFGPLLGLQAFTPLPILWPEGPGELSIMGKVMMGEVFTNLNPIIITLVGTLLFIFLAFWRFPKDEF